MRESFVECLTLFHKAQGNGEENKNDKETRLKKRACPFSK